MLKNYILIALRTILKHRVFSFINIFGLALGISCTALIGMWVNDELSYDRYNVNADRIYRIDEDIYLNDTKYDAVTTSKFFAPPSRRFLSDTVVLHLPVVKP